MHGCEIYYPEKPITNSKVMNEEIKACEVMQQGV